MSGGSDHEDDQRAKQLGYMSLDEVLDACQFFASSDKLKSQRLEHLFLSAAHHLFVLQDMRSRS